jgi:N-acetyltransferase
MLGTGEPALPDYALVGSVVNLEPVQSTDVAELFTVVDHADVWTHVAGRPRDETEYARQLAAAESIGRQPWVVRLRQPLGQFDAGAIVGTTSYLDVHPGDERCEIGYTAYHPSVWGTTVNPECKMLLLQAAFDAGFGRVAMKTDIRNLHSQRAIAALGAQREGVLRRYQRRADGSIRDTVMFSILAEEWPTVRDLLRARLSGA